MTRDPRTALAEDDPDVEAYTRSRRMLFGIAYRILGNAADAEDVLQETWVRWQLCDRGAVREPAAFLATTTTRLAINVLNSAHTRRETYIGPWLPSPVDTSNDPTLGAERAEALELATLLLMERLTPTERAAYVLREAFVYPYARIAEIVETTEAGARQLVSRARKHLAGDARRGASRDAQRIFFQAFLDAARRGDTAVAREHAGDGCRELHRWRRRSSTAPRVARSAAARSSSGSCSGSRSGSGAM